jgi:hypothetical protein
MFRFLKKRQGVPRIPAERYMLEFAQYRLKGIFYLINYIVLVIYKHKTKYCMKNFVHDEIVSFVAFSLFIRQKYNPHIALYLQVRQTEYL